MTDLFDIEAWHDCCELLICDDKLVIMCYSSQILYCLHSKLYSNGTWRSNHRNKEV
jgi:hypothetical protein